MQDDGKGNYIIESALGITGLAILFSPTGKIPRMPIELDQYKYLVGLVLVVISALLFLRKPRG